MRILAPPDCDFYYDFELSPTRLSLLRSCRQTYLEAIDFLYNKNTFDFAHPESFIWFTRTVGPDKLALIASIQLSMVSNTFSIGLLRLWANVCAIVTTWMPNLKFLAIMLLAKHFRQTSRQLTLLTPLMGLRGLQSFDLQLPDLPDSLWIPLEGTEVMASPLLMTLREQVSQSREQNKAE
jgi:hypothetical protein